MGLTTPAPGTQTDHLKQKASRNVWEEESLTGPAPSKENDTGTEPWEHPPAEEEVGSSLKSSVLLLWGMSLVSLRTFCQ